MFSFFKTPRLLVRFYVNTIEVINLDSNQKIKRIAIEPFSDSRIVLADFVNAEYLLRTIINEMIPKKFGITPSLLMVVQQVERNEGGISSIERRAYQDSCNYAGAKVVYVINQEKIMNEAKVLELLKTPKLFN